jgi:hypothetical protein
MIPRDVWLSDACLTLPYYARVVLIAIAFQYAGKNNGDLSMPWSVALGFGIRSKEHLVDALRLLLERGLIVKTRQGGRRPLGPTLYALTWLPIDDVGDKISARPTRQASNDWAAWSSGLPADQSHDKTKGLPAGQRAHLSGPPVDQRGPVSGLPVDREPQIIGTAGSPPSISDLPGCTHPVGAEGSSVGTDPGQFEPEVRHANSDSLDSPLEGPWLRNN